MAQLCFDTQKNEIIARLILCRIETAIGDCYIPEGQKAGQIDERWISNKEAEIVVEYAVDSDKEDYVSYAAIKLTVEANQQECMKPIKVNKMKMFCNFPFYHTNEQQELTVKFIVNGSAVRFIEQKANLIKKLIMESNDHYEPSRASDRLLKFTNNLDEGDDADEYMPITVCDQWVRGVALVYSTEFGHQTDNICLNITFKSNSELVDLATSSLPLNILEKGAA